MIGRVGAALILHETVERLRDRWVIVVSVLFALLASAVSLYGRKAGGPAMMLAGPSLVTLSSLFVPLVALVLSHDAIAGERSRNTLGLLLSLPVSRTEVVFAKFIGRGIALIIAVTAGITAAAIFSGGGQSKVLFQLLMPTLLLGLSFLALGMLISSVVSRPSGAASLVIVAWFGMVFFYDMGLLAILVLTDGGISPNTMTSLVIGNPTGLYQLTMMRELGGPDMLGSLGIAATVPSLFQQIAIWFAWIVGPVAISGVLLSKKKVLQ